MIGVSTAMWSSVSGLQVYGTQLGNIGTNIANSGSIGYKSTTTFATGGFAGHLSTLSGASTVAQGASVATVYTNHANGIGISSASSTHVAITGGGLFGVRNVNSDEILYTRRGDFEFKNDGYLATSEGYRVQGWNIPQDEVTLGTVGTTGVASRLKGSGVPGDIALPGDTSPPKHTTFVEIINNLGASSSPGNTTNESFPYFSLMTNWNGTATPPLGEGAYMYQSTIKVFDEGGSSHEITVYFDKVDTSNMTGSSPGEQWEFIVTMSPSEDKRQFGGTSVSGSSVAGLLMSGTLSFDSAGTLNNMTAFVPDANAPDAADLEVNGAEWTPPVNGGAGGTGDGVPNTSANNMTNWVPAPQSTNGLPIFFPNFSGSDSLAANGATDGTTVPENAIELNLGIRASNIGFQGLTNAQDFNPASQFANGTRQPGSVWNTAREGLNGHRLYSNATTNYAGSSSTLALNRDGNSFGILQDIQVDEEGVISALYSNGVKLEFAQLALYTFPDNQGLEYLNGSIYRATRSSGIGVAGVAGSGGRGSLQNYQLEQSNVDLSLELTNMIVTQNSYTACTKVVQTSNQALAAVISMV